MAPRDCCATIMALVLPPVGVVMVQGCGVQLCINLLLCLLGWVPGERFMCCSAPVMAWNMPCMVQCWMLHVACCVASLWQSSA